MVGMLPALAMRCIVTDRWPATESRHTQRLGCATLAQDRSSDQSGRLVVQLAELGQDILRPAPEPEAPALPV